MRTGNESALTLEPGLTPDADRIAPLALYFSTGRSPNEHADCRWEVQTAADSQHEHFLIGRLVFLLLPLQT